MSHRLYRSLWPSLATRLYRLSHPEGLQGYILYRQRTVVNRFLLVVLFLLVHIKGSTGVYHFDWSLFSNRDIRGKYTFTQRNKFDALQEISETPTPNDEYENFVNAHSEAVAYA